MNQILFHKEFDSVFGYPVNKMEMDFIFDKYHPEDAPFVKRIVKGSVTQLVNITIPEYSNILNMSYRFRKSDWTYAKILSNTIIHQTDDQDRVICVLIKYTDFSLNGISFAKGFQEFLGYYDKLMTLETYRNLMHPEDVDLVRIIGKATILHSAANPKESIYDVLYLSFRIKNKEGIYIKGLSQSSVFEIDVNGDMVSSLVKV